MSPTLVREIMTRDPICLREEDNLEHIAQGMEQFQLRHLPVVDDGRLVGLISHRDILRMAVSRLDRTGFAGAREHELEEAVFIAQVMTRDVHTVHPDAPVDEAAVTMVQHRFGCVPVVEEDGTLVGIVTEHDLLKLLVSMLHIEQQSHSGARRAISKFDHSRDEEADITPQRE